MLVMWLRRFEHSFVSMAFEQMFEQKFSYWTDSPGSKVKIKDFTV